MVSNQGKTTGDLRDDLQTADLVGRAAKQRWPVTPAMRTKAVEACMRSLESAEKLGNDRAVGVFLKSLAQMEAQNLADDHLADKNARVDDGKATETVRHVYEVEFDER